MTTPVYGRRQAFLVLLGLIYVVIGATNAVNPPAGNLEPYAAALAIVPYMGFWGTIWALSGLSAVVFAFWPPRHDMWAFASLSAWSSAWAVLCFLSTLWWHSERGWIAGLVWATFAGVVLIVSGMYGSGPLPSPPNRPDGPTTPPLDLPPPVDLR